MPEKASLLDVGCGPGRLWAENLDRLPEGWDITLTDASPGMVQEARGSLGGSRRRFDFLVADVRELPFGDGAFDAVIANHLLYHAPDRPKAFSEISRVLRTGGTLYAATNGEHTHKEMGWMRRVLDPTRTDETPFVNPLGFSLENGEEQLSPWFDEVALRRYEDSLVVTEVGPLVDYLLSGMTSDQLGPRVAELTDRLERELASRGAIRITKDVGLFVARK